MDAVLPESQPCVAWTLGDSTLCPGVRPDLTLLWGDDRQQPPPGIRPRVRRFGTVAGISGSASRSARARVRLAGRTGPPAGSATRRLAAGLRPPCAGYDAGTDFAAGAVDGGAGDLAGARCAFRALVPVHPG